MSKSNRAITIGLYLNAVLLATVAIALFSREGVLRILPAAFAQNQPSMGGGAGVYVVPAQFSVNNWGCYIMDIDQQTICAYQWVPAESVLRLMAARNFRYDRELTDFNTTKPSPADIKVLVEQAKQGPRVQDKPADRPSVEPKKPE